MISLREGVVSLIADELGVEPERCTDEAAILADLGADSLDVIELVMALEREFDCDLADEDVAKAQTVGALVALVRAAAD